VNCGFSIADCGLGIADCPQDLRADCVRRSQAKADWNCGFEISYCVWRNQASAGPAGDRRILK
jgi:hypothetical protein